MESPPVVSTTDSLYLELDELKTITGKKKSEITALRKQIDATIKERDGFNAEVKKASEEIRQLKSKRDLLNSRVRELKQKRGELQTAASEKREILTKLLEHARQRSEQLQGSMSELSKQIKQLEWFIQTNPLAPKTERNIITKIAGLEVGLAKHKVLKNVRDKLFQLRIEVGALRLQAQSTHDELTRLAKESEKVHSAMQEIVKVLTEKKNEADSRHKLFVQLHKQRQEAIRILRTSLVRIDQIRSEIGDSKISATVEKGEKVKSKYKEAANEKIRSGGRLSLEEFQALMSDSASAGDEE